MEKLKITPPSPPSTSGSRASLGIVPKAATPPAPLAPALTQRKFEQGIEVIGLLLPNLIDTPEKIDALYFCLQDLTDQEFGRGVQILALTHKEFYPNTNIVAILRDYALGDDTKTGVEAWGEVQRALVEMSRTPNIPYPDTRGMTPDEEHEAWRRHNEERQKGTPFTVDDPIADRIARAMGLRNLRYSQSEEVDRAHFIRAYDQLKAAEKRHKVAGRAAR